MKIGIIGLGRLGAALLKGLKDRDACVYDKDFEKIKNEKAVILKTPNEVAKKSDIIFLAVDPPSAIKVLGEIKNEVRGKTLVSLCAYVSIEKIKKAVPDATVIRIIPNFAIAVNQGVIALSADETPVDALKIIKRLGRVVIVDEEQLDKVTGLFACSPAYVSELINSLALLARKEGIEDELALELAIQTFLGTAALSKESVYSPSRLIEQIGAPGGSTEEGLKVMRDNKVAELFSTAVHRAIESAKEKTRRLAK